MTSHFSSSMSSTRNLNTYIFFLAMIFVTLLQQVPFSEGRKMKFAKEKEFMQTPNDVVDHHPATLSSSTPNDFSPTNPGRSPGVGHEANNKKVQILSSSTPDDFSPTNPGRSPGVGHSKHSADDSVSTNLGRSPGIGHSKHSADDSVSKNLGRSPGIGHSKHSADDSISTNLGRSPGIGHSKHSADDSVSTNLGRSPGIGHKDIGINGQDNKQIMHAPNSLHHPAPAHTFSSSPDDFKPTNPGRSPGVGHSFHTMKNKPNE